MEEEGEGHACVRRGGGRGESAWLGEAGGAERGTWEGTGNGEKREWRGSVWVRSWLGGSVRVGMDVCWGVLVTPRARE